MKSNLKSMWLYDWLFTTNQFVLAPRPLRLTTSDPPPPRPSELLQSYSLCNILSDEKMGLSITIIRGILSSVRIAHTACYWKFYLLHCIEVLCQSRLCKAYHAYLTYLMLQRQLSHLNGPKLERRQVKNFVEFHLYNMCSEIKHANVYCRTDITSRLCSHFVDSILTMDEKIRQLCKSHIRFPCVYCLCSQFVDMRIWVYSWVILLRIRKLDYVSLNRRMEDELERSWKLSGGTEESHENLSQDSRYFGRDSNWAPPEYKSRSLPTGYAYDWELIHKPWRKDRKGKFVPLFD
jgi:hypothetical protein